MLLALIYALASLTQVVVGHLIDKVSLKRLYLGMVLAQIPWLLLAATVSGWWVFVALLGVMVCIFGAIPFTDAKFGRASCWERVFHYGESSGVAVSLKKKK